MASRTSSSLNGLMMAVINFMQYPQSLWFTQIKANIAPEKFRQQMGQRLEMNNIRDLKFDEIAKVTNTDGLQVHKNYEIRKNFILNIDLVMKFEKDFDQSTVKTK